MKRLLVLFVAMSLLVSTYVFADADTCKMPPFIKKGALINLEYMEIITKKVVVMQTVKGSCWVMAGHNDKSTAWYNISAVDVITFDRMIEIPE